MKNLLPEDRVVESDIRNGLYKPYEDDDLLELWKELQEVEDAICIDSEGKVWRWDGIDEQEFLITVQGIVSHVQMIMNDMCTGELENLYAIEFANRLRAILKKDSTLVIGKAIQVTS